MIPVLEDRVVFSRDQIITATQASKNFGEVRKRAQEKPLYVTDRNNTIDTVIMSYDEFEYMVVKLDKLLEERFYDIAAQRLDRYDESRTIPLEDAFSEEELAALNAIDPDCIPDEDMFE